MRTTQMRLCIVLHFRKSLEYAWIPKNTSLFSQFTAYAYNTHSDQQTDDPLPITVLVEDENDNAPEFAGPMLYAVQEKCPMSKYEI